MALAPRNGAAQSADWQEVVWGEPQVRYLLADMTLGGNTKLYRDYATTERCKSFHFYSASKDKNAPH